MQTPEFDRSHIFCEALGSRKLIQRSLFPPSTDHYCTVYMMYTNDFYILLYTVSEINDLCLCLNGAPEPFLSSHPPPPSNTRKRLVASATATVENYYFFLRLIKSCHLMQHMELSIYPLDRHLRYLYISYIS
jgi:hypothetical protein